MEQPLLGLLLNFLLNRETSKGGGTMKLTCARAALLEAVTLAGALASARAAKPILQNVKLEAKSGHLDILGTDLEVGIRYRVENVEIAEEGELTVNAGRLMGIVRESHDEKLEIEVTDKTCVIKGSDSEFDLPMDEAGDFPEIPQFEQKGQVKIGRGELAEMVNKTAFAAASESTRYALNGVNVVFGNGKIEMVATDGRRLAYAKAKATGATAEMGAVIIPTKAMLQLQRVPGAKGMSEETPEAVEGTEEKKPAKKAKKPAAGAGEPAFISVQENQVRLQCGPGLVVSQLVEGQFPPYQEVIPKDSNKKATLQREAFLSAVRRTALLTTEEARSVKLTFGKGKVTLKSQAPEAGQATVELGVNYEGEGIEIAFNPTFLVEALRVMGDDEITMEMSEPSRPAVIRGEGDYLYVVMPINVMD